MILKHFLHWDKNVTPENDSTVIPACGWTEQNNYAVMLCSSVFSLDCGMYISHFNKAANKAFWLGRGEETAKKGLAVANVFSGST